MESTSTAVEIYQLRVWIRKISPQIWRRLLVRSDSTIAQLHDILQIAFGWSDEHLNRFLSRGKPYGVWKPGGMGFDDNPHQVRLRDFHFRCKEVWVYEYDMTGWWQHEIRLEQILPLDPKKQYPICIDSINSRAGAKQVQTWLMDILLPQLVTLSHTRVILASRSLPNASSGIAAFCRTYQLSPITDEEAYIDYCKNIGANLGEQSIRDIAYACDYIPGTFAELILPKFAPSGGR